MNVYSKKILATALFLLLFTAGKRNVNSMERKEEKIEQVSVRSTVDLVNKFEKLNDASDHFKKTFPGNWKNYLDLYNKCFKKIIDKKSDYIRNIEEYEKMYNSGVRNDGNLVEYEKILTENIECVDGMIKELCKKIDEKFGRLPKVGFLTSFFICNKPDDHTLLVSYVNKVSEDHRRTKREIAEKFGILTKKSINRNVLQVSDNSPLRRLEQLYDALQQSSGEFTFEKNILSTPKTFDSKVRNSIKKVIKCNLYKINGLKEMVNLYEEESIRALNEASSGQSNIIKKYYFGFGYKNSAILRDVLEVATKVKASVENFEFTKGMNRAAEFYVKVLGCREQLKLCLKI